MHVLERKKDWKGDFLVTRGGTLQEQFCMMNFKSAYDHLKTMLTDSSSRPPHVASSDPQSFSNELNFFYNRFDKSECSRLMSEGQFVVGQVNITETELRTQLRRVKPSKGMVPY